MTTQYGQVTCKECGAKSRVWVESLAYRRQLCPKHLGSPTKLLSEVVHSTKYFGVHGSLEGYGSGLYIIEAPNEHEALRQISKHFIMSPRYEGSIKMPELQEIKGEWAKVLSDTIDNIRNRETDYYVHLGGGVYFVEI